MVIVRSCGWFGGMIIVQGRPKTEAAEGKSYYGGVGGVCGTGVSPVNPHKES
jgi:hypothetical protein